MRLDPKKLTRLNIQLVEATLTDLSSFRVVEETGELTEADLAVGSYPLWVSINRTDWRFVGLRYVSTGEVGGSLTSLLQVEKPVSSKLSFEGRVVYGAGREVPLPPREPVRVG